MNWAELARKAREGELNGWKPNDIRSASIQAAGMAGHPSAEALFDWCNREYHSSGWYDVLYHFRDLADLMKPFLSPRERLLMMGLAEEMRAVVHNYFGQECVFEDWINRHDVEAQELDEIYVKLKGR